MLFGATVVAGVFEAVAVDAPDAEAAGTNLAAGNAAAPEVPADHAADLVYGADAMAMGRHHLQEFHGAQKIGQVFFNLAEYQIRNGRDAFEWDGEAWYGGDINRIWLKSEGDAELGRSVERAEVQALYSHAIGPYFNLQGGVRHDFRPSPSRTYATVGIEGLAHICRTGDAGLVLYLGAGVLEKGADVRVSSWNRAAPNTWKGLNDEH